MKTLGYSDPRLNDNEHALYDSKEYMLAFHPCWLLTLESVDESNCSMVLLLFSLFCIKVNVPLPNSPR